MNLTHKNQRKSIRLKGYDYSQEGLYFITLCCQDRLHLFGEIIDRKMSLNSFGEIARNEWLNTIKIRKNIKLHEFIIMPNHIHDILEITSIGKEIIQEEIGKFKSPSQTIGSIIRGYKIATIKRIKEEIRSTGELQFAPTEGERFGSTISTFRTGELQFAPTQGEGFTPTERIIQLDYKIWQRNYYEHIIRDDRAYHNISNYIRNNPLKWDEDKFK